MCVLKKSLDYSVVSTKLRELTRENFEYHKTAPIFTSNCRKRSHGPEATSLQQIRAAPAHRYPVQPSGITFIFR